MNRWQWSFVSYADSLPPDSIIPQSWPSEQRRPAQIPLQSSEKETGVAVLGLSSLPDSKPQCGHTSFEGHPRDSWYGARTQGDPAVGQNSYGFARRPWST